MTATNKLMICKNNTVSDVQSQLYKSYQINTRFCATVISTISTIHAQYSLFILKCIQPKKQQKLISEYFTA